MPGTAATSSSADNAGVAPRPPAPDIAIVPPSPTTTTRGAEVEPFSAVIRIFFPDLSKCLLLRLRIVDRQSRHEATRAINSLDRQEATARLKQRCGTIVTQLSASTGEPLGIKLEIIGKR